MYDSYRMDYAKGLMIVDCKGAEGEPDLKEPVCLAAVLRHLCKELRVDGLVLNHYREKHYGGKSLRALQEVLTLSSLFQKLAKQQSQPEFAGLSRKETQERCEVCLFNPGALFKRLGELLLGDLPNIDFLAFAAELTVKATELERHSFSGCATCKSRTVDDLSFLLAQIDSFSQALLSSCPRRCEE